MLAKVTNRRGDGRTSFRSLIAYITRTTGVILSRGADAHAENIQTSCLSLARDKVKSGVWAVDGRRRQAASFC